MVTPFKLPLATVALQRETGEWHLSSGIVPSLHVTSFAGSFHLPTRRGANGQAIVGSAVCRWLVRTEKPALSGQASAERGEGLEEARLKKCLGQAHGYNKSLCLSAAPLKANIGRLIGRQASWTGACSLTPLKERHPKGQGDAAGSLDLSSAGLLDQIALGCGAALCTVRCSAASLPRPAGRQ